MSKINMVYGNPAFLFKYWQQQDLPEINAYYPDQYMAEVHSQGLEEAIRNCHKVVDNVQNVDDYHIVIGNGASQLLSAILYETKGTSVSAPAPFFLRFPVLAQIGNNHFEHGIATWTEKVILSAPNNPTGDFIEYDTWYQHKLPIVDACYNWPQYCDVRALNDDILIFSLSKATGHAGQRLGWALIKDKSLADAVTRSVEMTTMGVSQLSQEIGRFVLSRESGRFARGEENVFQYGKDELAGRWLALQTHPLPFKILNKNGMFAWCEGEIPDHVEGVLGSQCGSTNKHFRLNIGCDRMDFVKFMGPYLPELVMPEVKRCPGCDDRIKDEETYCSDCLEDIDNGKESTKV